MGTAWKILVLLLVIAPPAHGDVRMAAQTFAQSSWEASASTVAPGRLQAAPGQPIRFEQVSLEEGLSQSSVYCILQDSRGFLWFGTEDGLNKYDGYSFTVYRHVPGDPTSLSHNLIWTLHQDREGALWIGTVGGGLNRLDPDTGQAVQYRADTGPDSLTSDFVRAIYEDREGILWIGTDGGGLNRFDPSTERFTQVDGKAGTPNALRNGTVRTIYADREGSMWIGTDGDGLSLFDPTTEQWAHYTHKPGDPYSLSSNTVWAIYQDREGELWIGTDGGGLNRFERATGRFIHYEHDADDPYSLSDNTVSAIYEDREGLLWVGTFGGGLNALDRIPASEPSRWRFIRYQSDLGDVHSLSNDFVWSIYEDQLGMLWIGTHGGGVNKYNRLARPFVHYRVRPNDENSLSNSVVWAIYEDGEGVLWVGTNGGGLDRFDRSAGRVAHYRNDPVDPNSLSNNVVRAICEDRAGGLWLGMDDGMVDRFDRSTGSFEHYQVGPGDERGAASAVLTIYEDGTGMLWAGTAGDGLYWFDQAADRFVYYRERFCAGTCLSAEHVKDIHQDPEGVLWIASPGGGLNRFEPAKGQFTYYLEDPADANSLSNNSVLSIHQDKDGILWLGTLGGGLNRFDPDHKTFTHYREGDGLANDVVYGILEDSQGHLWLSTNRGLSKFDPRTETFKNYDASDGLQSNEFNGGAYSQSPSGEMFFGGINGFNAFFPEQVSENLQPPPIVVTAFKKFNQTVCTDLLTGEQVRLPYQDNFVSFEFAALDYTAPEQNQYAYRMEGLDRDWVYVGTRRHVDYPDLKPGQYTFRVKGSNSDGVWNEDGTWIGITITPPFWETWWFRGMLLVVLVGSVVGAHRLRVRSIEARNRDLAILVEQRTAELRREADQRMQAEEALRQGEMEKAVAAERSRLARDLHDAVSQTLFSAGLMAEALPQSWERDQEEGRHLLKELRQLIVGALAEMRMLLLELRPVALVEASLRDLVLQLAEAATAREGLPITVNVEGQGTLPPDVHIALYRITQEALNNVIKHAHASQVDVSLRCITRDDGRGTANGKAHTRVRGGEIGSVELTIRDDGRGFDLDSVPPDCLGLGIMRERAASIGARLAVESQVGAGTKVIIVWNGDKGRAAANA